jgi:hypothetical protein
VRGNLLLLGPHPFEADVAGIGQGDRERTVPADPARDHPADFEMEPNFSAPLFPGEGNVIISRFPRSLSVPFELEMQDLAPGLRVDSLIFSGQIPTWLAGNGEGKEHQQKHDKRVTHD